MKFDLVSACHGLHLATEENWLAVMKFMWSFFFTLADVGEL
jgi:hypothetical protein